MLLCLLLLAVQSPTAAAILKLEDGWASALLRRDSLAFERMLAPGFIYSEDDKTLTRQETLRALFAGGETVTRARNEAMQVHDFGSTVIVTGWLSVASKSAQGTVERRYRFTDVWMRKGNRWQIVAAHDYLKPT